MDILENTVPTVENSWEIKDRVYLLKNKKPLTLRLNSKNNLRHPLMWFDEEKGHQRELRYATNQPSPFVDEQKGPSTLGHIVFQSGRLIVPREQQNLQKLLSLYHPSKDVIYTSSSPALRQKLQNLHCEKQIFVIFTLRSICHPT